MADALLGVAFENLISLLQNEFSTISGISSKTQKLSTNLELIKAVLEDAEKKQVKERSIKVWLQQLKDAVYVLDDILDECSIKSNRLKGSCAFKNIIFRHNIGTRLKEITSRFDEIAKGKNNFLLQEGVTAKEMTVEVAEWRQTSSIIAEPKVVSSLGSLIHLSLEKGNSLAELRDLNLRGVLSIKDLNNVGSLSEAQEANLMCKKDLQELCLSWKITSGTEITKTPTINVEQSLKDLRLYKMDNLKYLDEESYDGVGVRIFPSLEELKLENLPKVEGLLKVERGEMFPCLSKLIIDSCPNLALPCLPSLKDLHVWGCNNELLWSISTFCGLTELFLNRGDEGITSFPEGIFANLTLLQTLEIFDFPKLKELPNEPFNLTLVHMKISLCNELESLPEQIWESLQSLQSLTISNCKGLRCLPEGLRCLPKGIRHLTSLEVLTIRGCPTLEKRCKEGTGKDWDKIAHIPKLKSR
ncbi:hypothetical protein P8452_43847 [Trifolium repens]|nr:hypothetical protein P8452_43847 [Trifolium repens]